MITINKEKKTVMRPVEELVVTDVTLTITIEQAKTLLLLCGAVGGNKQNTIRKYTEPLCEMLSKHFYVTPCHTTEVLTKFIDTKVIKDINDHVEGPNNVNN